MVELTKEQCSSLVELIEISLFEIIRNDPDIDNIDWLINITDVYKAANEALKKEKTNGV